MGPSDGDDTPTNLNQAHGAPPPSSSMAGFFGVTLTVTYRPVLFQLSTFNVSLLSFPSHTRDCTRFGLFLFIRDSKYNNGVASFQPFPNRPHRNPKRPCLEPLQAVTPVVPCLAAWDCQEAILESLQAKVSDRLLKAHIKPIQVRLKQDTAVPARRAGHEWARRDCPAAAELSNCKSRRLRTRLCNQDSSTETCK